MIDERTRQKQAYKPGEIVYVLYRNPHAQDVVHIQEAAVVEHPEAGEELCLFLYETYYPLNEQLAIFKTEEEAQDAYSYYFGETEGDFNA